jgi:uncharacterized membrane protein YdjX (TVP38/TMEM64 family)
MRRLLPPLLLAVVAAAVFAGRSVRTQLGVDYAPESLQAFIESLGVAAPLMFLAIVIFRQVLLLPSMLVLTAGGLAFGPWLGTLLGGLGILISGLLLFGVGHGIGGAWVQDWIGERFAGFEKRVNAAGPALIGLSTAHPMGPMTPFHWAAGLSTIRALPFAMAITVGGLFRSFAYALFGSTLTDIGSKEFYVASVVLVALAALPLLNRSVRETVFARDGASRPG